MSRSHMQFAVSDVQADELARSWLLEDQTAFDVGGAIFGQKKATATLYCKQGCKMSGKPFADAVFRLTNCEPTWVIDESSDIEVKSGEKVVVAKIAGMAKDLLRAERVVLNCMTRCSGITTVTSRISKKMPKPTRLACTRKTTPGFRLPEKYAVVVGGGDPHRFGLSSMIMLKDNHVNMFGGDISKGVEAVRKYAGIYTKIEVEARDVAEAGAACAAGVDILMLDNFVAQKAKETAANIKQRHPHVLIECSGGITEASVVDFCSPHIDIVSMGSLTQGYPTIDFSMKIDK